MAIIQYSNGFIDQTRPKDQVFSDIEILDLFFECNKIRSRRLLEIPNSWCIWGEIDLEEKIDYNPLGSKIVEENIFSKLVIIHDTELNPEWNLTDKLIINSYNDFRENTYEFMDELATEVINEKMEEDRLLVDGNDELQETSTPKLLLLGPTEDKKILMEFVPKDQIEGFWDFSNFSNFALKSFEYLHGFIDQNLGLKSNAFVIYADKKGIIIIKDKNVEEFLEKLLDNFEKREKYQGCSHVLAISKKWKDYVKNGKKAMTGKWSDYAEKKSNEKK